MNETTNLGILGISVRTIGDSLLTIAAVAAANMPAANKLPAVAKETSDNLNVYNPNNINNYIKKVTGIELSTDFSGITPDELAVIGNIVVLIGDLLLLLIAVAAVHPDPSDPSNPSDPSQDINAKINSLELVDGLFSVIGDIAGVEAALLAIE